MIRPSTCYSLAGWVWSVNVSLNDNGFLRRDLGLWMCVQNVHNSTICCLLSLTHAFFIAGPKSFSYLVFLTCVFCVVVDKNFLLVCFKCTLGQIIMHLSALLFYCIPLQFYFCCCHISDVYNHLPFSVSKISLKE